MTNETERLAELAGIINSKLQLVNAAADLAKKQLEAARKILDEKDFEPPSAKAVEVAKLIAANMSFHDLVTAK